MQICRRDFMIIKNVYIKPLIRLYTGILVMVKRTSARVVLSHMLTAALCGLKNGYMILTVSNQLMTHPERHKNSASDRGAGKQVST